MAGTSLLALIDDIATILDDVSLMTKVAAKKTAGVLGDDLALNAQQVVGVQADREIPVVLAVAKGSAINKAILVPSALLISFFLPWLITPLLMLGGLFLCFEGAEKLVHKYLHADEADNHAARVEALADANVDMVAFEKEKIKGAVRTDFILSAEIIVIALGTATAAGADLVSQTAVLVIISVVMTIGGYGLVAGLVKIDDLGLHLLKKTSNAAKTTGRLLLAAAPKLMKFLSVAGTIAMFLVGGGILVHGVPALHHGVTDLSHLTGMFSSLTGALLNGLIGLLAGGLVVGILMLFQKLRGTPAH